MNKGSQANKTPMQPSKSMKDSKLFSTTARENPDVVAPTNELKQFEGKSNSMVSSEPLGKKGKLF